MARLDSEVTRLREVARKLRVELEHETQNATHVESPEVEKCSAAADYVNSGAPFAQPHDRDAAFNSR
jgi:hypothetical protein